MKIPYGMANFADIRQEGFLTVTDFGEQRRLIEGGLR